jgi:hypothetical protein
MVETALVNQGLLSDGETDRFLDAAHAIGPITAAAWILPADGGPWHLYTVAGHGRLGPEKFPSIFRALEMLCGDYILALETLTPLSRQGSSGMGLEEMAANIPSYVQGTNWWQSEGFRRIGLLRAETVRLSTRFRPAA